jgi:hypothetical protein
VLKAGRQLTFALHKLFPTLNYPVIAGLDRIYLDAVDESYQRHDGDQLTERETKDFVLMHCFSIVPKLIKTPVELLKVLLSLHGEKRSGAVSNRPRNLYLPQSFLSGSRVFQNDRLVPDLQSSRWRRLSVRAPALTTPRGWQLLPVKPGCGCWFMPRQLWLPLRLMGKERRSADKFLQITNPWASRRIVPPS